MFVAKPAYSRRELTDMLNAHEARRTPRGRQRKRWNRERTRAFLRAGGLLSQRQVPLERLAAIAPDLVRTMVAGRGTPETLPPT